MSINVRNIVFHQLVRKSDSEIDLVLRDSDMPVNQPIIDLVSDIHKVYEKKQKAYGLFNEVSVFSSMLVELQNQKCDFLQFSTDSTKLLRNELAKYPFADGGSVMFCFYNYLAVDYLIIAVLDSRGSMLIDEKLDIATTQYLDIQNASIMCQINLTEWKTEPESIRYLSFIKGRLGRKVADFFMDFLGASEGMNTKNLNKTLVQVVEDYCVQLKADKKDKQQIRDQVYSYCVAQSEMGEEINLDHLAKEVPISEENNLNFRTFIKQNDYEIDDEFPVDKTIIKSLKKYSGAGGGLTINFDADLIGERICWYPQTDTIVIKGIPPNLRDQLQRKGLEG